MPQISIKFKAIQLKHWMKMGAADVIIQYYKFNTIR